MQRLLFILVSGCINCRSHGNFSLTDRSAARGEQSQFGGDLTLGIQLVWFLALPVTVGLMLMAEPLARLLFERGQFASNDTVRASKMIVGFNYWSV